MFVKSRFYIKKWSRARRKLSWNVIALIYFSCREELNWSHFKKNNTEVPFIEHSIFSRYTQLISSLNFRLKSQISIENSLIKKYYLSKKLYWYDNRFNIFCCTIHFFIFFLLIFLKRYSFKNFKFFKGKKVLQ